MKKWYSFVSFAILLFALIWYQRYMYLIATTFQKKKIQEMNYRIGTNLIHFYQSITNSTLLLRFGRGYRLLFLYFKNNKLSAKIQPFLPKWMHKKLIFYIIDQTDEWIVKVWIWVTKYANLGISYIISSLTSNSNSTAILE
jgi:hypothetical protein